MDDDPAYPAVEYAKVMERRGVYERLKMAAFLPLDLEGALVSRVLQGVAYHAQKMGQIRLPLDWNGEVLDVVDRTETSMWPREDGTFETARFAHGYVLGWNLTRGEDLPEQNA